MRWSSVSPRACSGRHIGDGSHRGARRGELIDADRGARGPGRRVDHLTSLRSEFCQTEVQDLGLPALGDKDIGRLDVAVHNSAGVGGIERVGDLDSQIEQLFNLERTALDLVFEGYAVQILHGDEGLPVLLADVVNGADIGMVQGRGRLRFALEAAEGLRIFGYIFGKELQRDEAVQSRVFGLVNHTHAAATEHLNDSVVGNGLADHDPSGVGLFIQVEQS